MQFLGLAIAFIAAFWVYTDAKNRGKSTGKAFLWFLGVFFVLITVSAAVAYHETQGKALSLLWRVLRIQRV